MKPSLSQVATYAKRNKGPTAAAILLILVGFMFMRKSTPDLALEPAKVEALATFIDEVHCMARPRALSELYLSVQHGGRLEVLTHAAGSPVTKGQIIAVVDRTSNAASLKSALSGFRLAQSEHHRTSGLLRSGSATREEMDSAASKLEVKRAELEQAKQRVEDSVVRAPIDGIVSVVVFKVGDKVPDGGRIAAVEDPTGTQASCRLPAEVAAQLPLDQVAVWTMVDGNQPMSWTVNAKLQVEQPSGGFTGLDREVRVETTQGDVKTSQGKLTDITLKLPPRNNVTRLPSLAVVRRDGGASVLVRKGREYEWRRINVVKQTAQETVAEGVPSDGEILLLKDDLSKIEAFVTPRLARNR